MKEKEVKYRRHSDYQIGETPEYIHLKIIVKTEEEKQEMLKASKYIHDFSLYGLDADIMGVNRFMHLYMSPECIEVRPDENFVGFDN